MQRFLGVDRRRKLPRIAGGSPTIPIVGAGDGVEGERVVVLFVDTFAEFSQPASAEAARRVLEAAGYRVVRARGQGCCGRPMISKGLLIRARQVARRNIQALYPFAEKGIPIVGLEPSCLLTFRDEYREFFPSDRRTEAVAGASRLLEEFLTEPDRDGRSPIENLAFMSGRIPVAVHGHCHAKSLIGMTPLVDVLRGAGAEVSEIDSGCCGMAGSFGYETEHYDLSMQIGGMKLFPGVRRGVERGGVVVAPGTSCRAQIADGTGVTALDLSTFLASRLQPR